jgi:hypothetical protein
MASNEIHSKQQSIIELVIDNNLEHTEVKCQQLSEIGSSVTTSWILTDFCNMRNHLTRR